MVNGWCMGGGHELALWCDMVIASELGTDALSALGLTVDDAQQNFVNLT